MDATGSSSGSRTAPSQGADEGSNPLPVSKSLEPKVYKVTGGYMVARFGGNYEFIGV